eukprot:15447779-Alexandrium_andersonii.AAC.1
MEALVGRTRGVRSERGCAEAPEVMIGGVLCHRSWAMSRTVDVDRVAWRRVGGLGEPWGCQS